MPKAKLLKFWLAKVGSERLDEIAIPVYESFVQKLRFEFGKPTQTGVFSADMKVSLINDRPVTIVIDSKNKE